MEDFELLRGKIAQYEKENKELALRLEELNDFVENASLPLHWVNAEGIIIWANQAEFVSLGYTREEYIGFPISNFHADQEVIQDILYRLTNNQTLLNYPARLRCKNGDIKNVLINSSVLWKEGKFVHTRCFTRDVTPLIQELERKAELMHDLEQNETKLKIAIESTNLGTWEWDPKANILFWSEECRNVFGYPAAEQITFDEFSKMIHPEDRSNVIQSMHESIESDNGETNSLTYRIHRFNDNEMRWIKAQWRRSFKTDRYASLLIGTTLDITDVKYAEEKSAKLAAIVNSSNDAVISKTLNGIITSWNDSAERTFGYSAEEIIGQPIMKLIPPDREEEEIQILSRLSKGERVDHFETRRITKTGKMIDVSLTISPVKDPEGKIIGLSKIARDITERKQEEQRKNDFVAMVSHELKTPLTALTGYLQLLLMRSRKEGDEFSVKSLIRAEAQTKKMVAMIHDFLSLARMEEGKLQIEKREVELHPLMMEIAEDAKFLTSLHTIKLIDCEGIIINADRDKIGQVLMNLVSNAIKYSPEGGLITLGCERQNGKVKIYVSDQGIGISPNDQKRLFERFYRVNNNGIKTVPGFGIGLYLVSEILRYHDSEIVVESEENVGSVFYFYLQTLSSSI
ncbi:PAS domain S-box-containing protein [Pedobacter cryoconitis]|uniref:histidine kinase n=1 Tax=Pedobacter cryoconitis TaxID=188932 RepID=A0A7W9DLP8_9SPHI|nr:PAS domain S-box protein [Pedobacter cryoconitis]MBB5623526.1 PAS domain S-box-containing protein [Pedobacter cryoconitis]